MKFFSSLIKDFSAFTEPYNKNKYAYNGQNCWKDIGYNEVIMQRDTAFELSGTGFNLITSSPVESGVTVIGDDLGNITESRKFARVSLVQLEQQEDEQKIYNLIRKVEYVKYHYFPEGYMMRTSSRSHKEAVRVSKKAVKNGISFETAGNLLIKKYKEIPAVKSVNVIFITKSEIDYNKLEAFAVKGNVITEALNHIMNSVKFDCETCNLKPVCDEVEGMKELHFKSMGM